MSKLQLIEKKLSTINDAVFQELCDAFLLLRNNDYRAFSRSGMAIGKQKVAPGTPDSFFLLPNNKFLFVEATTQTKGLYKKLEQDVKKCLNKATEEGTTLQGIILCFNSRLSLKETSKLKDHINEEKIDLKLYDIDELSIEIFFNHRGLANEYLGIPLDSGQVVLTNQFIKEYDRASHGIATPLDNDFVERNELNLILETVEQNPVVILTGAAGVGKTKLALEAIREYLQVHNDYEAYCISYKGVDLINDLYSQLDLSKNYILFVDDANRIDAFAQIMGFYKTQRKGSLKLILTVRDYALEELKSQCFGFPYIDIIIPKLSEEKIVEIIKGNSFNIKNSKYQNEIIRIADGNPRIAIMAARLAIEKQNLAVLRDTTDLFDRYFTTLLNDNKDLLDSVSLKILGIIAFFFSLPYKDRGEISFVLDLFQLSYDEFVISLDKLEKAEMIERKHDYVRIPEQNLSTYFFFKSFIQTDNLSFETLLFNFFTGNKSRFKETIIAANNFFGPERVMSVLKPVLQKYLATLKAERSDAFELLKVFWFYLQEEVLEFIYELTVSLTVPDNPVYETHYEMNDYTYHKDEYLKLLSNLYHHTPDKLKPILELSFEYAYKRPDRLPELVKNIRDYISFDEDDFHQKFDRQFVLFDILYSGVRKGEQHLVQAFFALSNSFLKFEFEHRCSEKKNTISFYKYKLPLTDEIKLFRRKIWETINEIYSTYPAESLKLFERYGNVHPDVSKDVMQYDSILSTKIIKRHLKKSNFVDCYIAQQFVRWLKRNKVKSKDLALIKSRFVNSKYKLFINLSWDRFRDKESFEFDDHKEYDLLKESSVRKTLKINTLSEFKKFYREFIFLYRWSKKTNHHNLTNSLDIIIDEIADNDIELSMKVIQFIIEEGNEPGASLYRLYTRLLTNPFHAKRIWEIISIKPYEKKNDWQELYFICTPEENVNDWLCNNFIEWIKSIKGYASISFSHLSKLELHNNGIFEEALRIIEKKNRSGAGRIFIGYGFFQKNGNSIQDLELMQKIYLQQDHFHSGSGFDYDGKDLLAILNRDPKFLLEYALSLVKREKRNHQREEHELDKLSIVWEIEGVEQYLLRVLKEITIKAPFRLIRKDFCNHFFSKLNGVNEERVDRFVFLFIEQNSSVLACMKMIFDVILNSRPHLFEAAFKLYLRQNADPIFFTKIQWIKQQILYPAEANVGAIMATQWKNLLPLVEAANIGLKAIPIKKIISSEINSGLNWAEYMKKEKFRYPDW